MIPVDEKVFILDDQTHNAISEQVLLLENTEKPKEQVHREIVQLCTSFGITWQEYMMNLKCRLSLAKADIARLNLKLLDIH